MRRRPPSQNRSNCLWSGSFASIRYGSFFGAIPPFPLAGDALHAVQRLCVELIVPDIREALDGSLTSLPGPGRVPGDRVATGRVYSRALRAIGGLVFPPGVVVQSEVSLRGGGILRAEIPPSYEGFGHSGRRGQGQKRRQGQHGLHLRWQLGVFGLPVVSSSRGSQLGLYTPIWVYGSCSTQINSLST